MLSEILWVCSGLDLTSARCCDLRRLALPLHLWRCDARQMAGSQRGRKETASGVPSLPRLLPSCQSQCFPNVPGLILGCEEEEEKDSEGEKRGWSLQLKWKHQQGKQSGFPPVVINSNLSPFPACHRSASLITFSCSARRWRSTQLHSSKNPFPTGGHQN